MIRLVIVDDDPLVIAGLRAILDPSEIQVVGTADDGLAALRMLETMRVDAVLLDVNMPRMNGVAATVAIRARLPGVRLVLMTSFNAGRFEPHARVAGADAFISKSASPQEFLSALTDAGQEAQSIRKPPAPRLSPRERDVANRIAGGASNMEIADALNVSVNTVKTYVSRLFVKFSASNRVQLANALNGVLTRGQRDPGRERDLPEGRAAEDD